MVINIAAYVENDEIRQELIRCAAIRSEALRRCYSIPGYKELPLAEKNKIYDRIVKEVETK